MSLLKLPLHRALPDLSCFSLEDAFPSYAVYRKVWHGERDWAWDIEVYFNCHPASDYLPCYPCCSWVGHYLIPNTRQAECFLFVVFSERVTRIPAEDYPRYWDNWAMPKYVRTH